MLHQLKEQVYTYNMELVNNRLVLWTSGNVSGRDPETGYVVIKPSGVNYHDLTPDNMVVTDLTGNIIEGNLKPSVDLLAHLEVYKQFPEVNGITHTHSPYATAFAIVGKDIPIYTTTAAAVFGNAIPVSNLAAVGEVAIGLEIVKSYQRSKCPAVLIKNHGVFTIGSDAKASLKSAVIIEETAQSVYYALTLDNQVQPLSQDYINHVYSFYQTGYGQ